MSGKKILAIGFVIVLLVAIPLTVFLIQQQQKTKSSANTTTVLSLVPTPQNNVTPGTDVTLNVMLDPGGNQVSFVKFIITYDTGQLAVKGGNSLRFSTWKASNGDTVTPQVLDGPRYDATNGTMTMTISVQSSPQHVISTPTQIASVVFDTTKLTQSTQVKFDQGNSQVLSINNKDRFNENVLNLTNPAIIAPPVPTTPSPSPSPSPSVTQIPTPTDSPTPTTVTQAITGPTCSSLTIDPSAQGTPPFTVNLTANGQDYNSTISDVKFDFGDGQTQDIASSAGIGTNSISVLQSHIYNDPGNYTATVVLTDANGSISPIGVCTVAISVNNEQLAEAPTATITQTPSPLPPTGPTQLITFGSIGAVITVIGAVLLLAL